MPQSTTQLFDVNGRRKYLTHSERISFEEAANSLTVKRKLFCLVMLYTGCRISEALALNKDRIDADESFIVFITLKQKSNKEQHLHQRPVPIPRWLTDELISTSDSDENTIWDFSRTTGWRIIKNAMSLVQIRGVHATPRGLRHGFGIACAQANLPITMIAKAMGHSNLKTTSIYLNAVGKEHREFFSRTWLYQQKSKKDLI